MSLESLPDWTTILSWAQPFLIKLAGAAVIFVIGLWVSRRISNYLGRLVQRTRRDDTLSTFLSKFAYVVLFVFVAIAALTHLGLNTTAAAAIVGASALAIGLSLQNQLSSFAAGIMLILYRPFRIGDFIEAGGVSGTVTEIHMFKTILRTPNNQIIYVTNAEVWETAIINYSAEPIRRIDLNVGVSYDADLRKTRQVLEQAIAAEERILPEPEPVIAVGELADSAVVFKVRPWVNTADYWATLWDLTERVKLALDDAGICIPYPQMDVHLRKQAINEEAT